MKYLYIFEYYNEINKEFYFLRKEPKYIPFFKKLMEEDTFLKLSKVEEVYNDIKQHRNTLKQYNIDILSAQSIEEVEDMVQEAKLIEKFNKFTKLLPHNIRNEVRNDREKALKFRHAIIDMEYDSYKNIFLKKVSKYNTFDDMYSALENYISGNNKSMEKLISEIEKSSGIDIYYKDINVLIAIVFSKKASCEYGSQQWCISGNRGSYWDSYVPEDMGVQYFVWDFRKKESDPSSQIGVTKYYEKSRRGNYVANDKSDSSINVRNEYWFKELKNIVELDKKYLTKYLLYNYRKVMKNPIHKDSNLISDIVNDPNFKRKSFEIDPVGYLEISEDLSFLTDKEIEDMTTKNPDMINYTTIDSRLSKEYLRNFIVENPKFIQRFDKDFIGSVDEERLYKLMYNMTQYLDNEVDWGYKRTIDTQADVKVYYIVDSKEDYFKSEDFILRFLKEHPSESFRYLGKLFKYVEIKEINDLYRENKKEWYSILYNKDEDMKKKTISPKWIELFQSYFRNEGAMQKFEESDLYVFNARYKKVKVGENHITKKPLYEEVLDIERMIKIEPFDITSASTVKAMQLRVMVQGDINTYGLWVSKDLLDEDTIESMSHGEESTWFLDLVDRLKFKY